VNAAGFPEGQVPETFTARQRAAFSAAKCMWVMAEKTIPVLIVPKVSRINTGTTKANSAAVVADVLPKNPRNRIQIDEPTAVI
jgi:hypothetical protein